MTQRRVVIIGAGMGGLSAAWHLSKSRKDLRIEVYEASWVPGGKAVSGRAEPPTTAGDPHLIEEHGLHMLFGTYRETWQMLADCYQAVKRPVSHAFRRIEQAFTPQERIVFHEQPRQGRRRQHWVFSPELHQGRPWDSPAAPALDDQALLRQLIAATGRERQTLQATAFRMRGATAVLPGLGRVTSAARSMLAQCAVPDCDTTAAMRSWARKASGTCTARRSLAFARDPSLSLLQILRLATSAQRSGELLDLSFAILDGTGSLVASCTCPPSQCRCFDRLNGIDLHRWLLDNGLRIDNDNIVRGFYAGLFARFGELAAGVGLRAILRVLFDYRGALVYRMEAGMGEVVVAPIFQALRNRDVRFKFLHRLTDIKVDGRRIAALGFEDLGPLPDDYDPLKQTTTLQGTIDYFPNTPPASVASPKAPLPRGEFRRMHRRWPMRGTPVPVTLDPEDCVILAVPPTVLRSAADALTSEPQWREFLHGETATRSRPVVSGQIWRNVRPDAAANPIGRTVAAGHSDPFNIWADMTHILSREGLPHRATELSFMCGLGPDAAAATQITEIENAGRQIDDWLSAEASFMLGREGEEVERYVAASLEPSDHYVLSTPGTVESRIAPAATGFDNLRVAGDWVKSGLDCGCVESAVTGGLLAAKSIP